MLKFTAPISRDFLSPPGDSIKKIIDEKGWTQKELSKRIDISEKHLTSLIQGKSPLTPEMADKLSMVLGHSSVFWTNREAKYRERLQAIEDKEVHEECIQWAKLFPLKDLQAHDIIPAGIINTKFISSNLKKILTFFGVSSHSAWTNVYGSQAIMYRKSESHAIDENAVVTWLRMGEIYAENNPCANKFNLKKLHSKIAEIRSLTTQPPEIFEPKLKEILNECGIIFCIVDAFKNTRTSGAVRIISSGNPLLQLSIYGKTNDLFWFTLFHELAHIILHLDKESIFLDDPKSSADDDIEKQANEWARNILIPSDYTYELPELLSKVSINEFAEKIDIHPGIVVGRLQYDKVLPYSHCNDLKTTFALR